MELQEKEDKENILKRISKSAPLRLGTAQTTRKTKKINLLYFFIKKKLYGPFSWMALNYLKAKVNSRMQFTFYCPTSKFES